MGKIVGGSGDDKAYCVQETKDGGYIVAGSSCSNDGDVVGNHGSCDLWIVKLDSAGTIVWQKSLGGSWDDYGAYVQQTTDNGFIVFGSSGSTDGDVSVHYGYTGYGYTDYWIVKLDTTGSIQWEKTYGGSRTEVAGAIKQTTDGGYIAAGSSSSNDSDVTGHHGAIGLRDCWIIKLDSAGFIQWQKSIGGLGIEYPTSVEQTLDGEFVFTGITDSQDGDVTNNHGLLDCWTVKLNSQGYINWQKTNGGSQVDRFSSLQLTPDSGFVVAGLTYSTDGDVVGNHGGQDGWVMKLDKLGNPQWHIPFGGTDYDAINSIQQTSDGGFIFAGYSSSNDGDVATHIGSSFYSDYLIMKLSSLVSENEIPLSKTNLQISPNPTNTETQISFTSLHFSNFIIMITDFMGSLVKILPVPFAEGGRYNVVWDGTNNENYRVLGGMYFITISSDHLSETKKVVILKN